MSNLVSSSQAAELLRVSTLTVGYTRCSSQDQKEDLKIQVLSLDASK